MAKVCEKCGRGKIFSQSRSKSKIASKRTHEINLQIKRIGNKKIKICTRCIRTLGKEAK